MKDFEGDARGGLPRRRSIRLKGYDYALAGAYFITVCAHGHARIFGKIAAGRMVLNDLGAIVQAGWDDLPNHNPGLELGPFVVMPNHIHGILVLTEPPRPAVEATAIPGVGAGSKPAHGPIPPDGPSGANDDQRGNRGAFQDGAGLEPAPTAEDDHAAGMMGDWDGSDEREAVRWGKKRPGLSEIVRQLKTFSARRINLFRGTPGQPVWQRNYWEHIIRDETAYAIITQYILTNSVLWEQDQLYGG